VPHRLFQRQCELISVADRLALNLVVLNDQETRVDSGRFSPPSDLKHANQLFALTGFNASAYGAQWTGALE